MLLSAAVCLSRSLALDARYPLVNSCCTTSCELVMSDMRSVPNDKERKREAMTMEWRRVASVSDCGIQALAWRGADMRAAIMAEELDTALKMIDDLCPGQLFGLV